MSEYFEISIIGFEKNKEKDLKEYLNLSGNGILFTKKLPFLNGKYVQFQTIQNEIQISIRPPSDERIFKEDTFKNAQSEFESLFKEIMRILKPSYILASFELNGYLLSDFHQTGHFDPYLLTKFPFSFYKQGSEDKFIVNLDAQNIF